MLTLELDLGSSGSSHKLTLLEIKHLSVISLLVFIGNHFERLLLLLGQSGPSIADCFHDLGYSKEGEPLPDDLSELLAEIDISRKRLFGLVLWSLASECHTDFITSVRFKAEALAFLVRALKTFGGSVMYTR